MNSTQLQAPVVIGSVQGIVLPRKLPISLAEQPLPSPKIELNLTLLPWSFLRHFGSHLFSSSSCKAALALARRVVECAVVSLFREFLPPLNWGKELCLSLLLGGRCRLRCLPDIKGGNKPMLT